MVLRSVKGNVTSHRRSLTGKGDTVDYMASLIDVT